MALGFSNLPGLGNPLMGYRFGVFFLGKFGLAHPLDFRFQEVSGLEARVEMSSISSMGEGDKSSQFPGKTSYPSNLLLKRGMPVFSTFRWEVHRSLQGSRRIARTVLVSILDENALPLNSFKLSDAYPVYWSLSGLDASSSQLVVETMELKYSKLESFSL